MRRIAIILTIMALGFSASSQTLNPFPTTDSLRKFINKWIRNSAVDAFTNLRLNSSLISMTRFLDSAYGGQVTGFTYSSDTLRLSLLSGQVLKVALPSAAGNTNVGSGFRLLVPSSQGIKTLFAGNTVLIDSTSNTDGLTFKVDTTVIATLYDITLKTDVSRFLDSCAALRAAIGSGGGGSAFSLVSDIFTLPETKIYSPAQGVASSANVANYSHTSLDSSQMKFTTTGVGTKRGGWLAPSTSGDSIKVTAPFWVVFGDSQAEGHPGRHGRLHPLVSGSAQNIFLPTYPDSVGQLSYHLRERTNMRWYNHGIGGQTTVQMRLRFYRDVLGLTVANMADGRGNQTLNRKPEGVVIIAGINDVFGGVSMDVIKANFEWFASTCQQWGVRCVMTNLPGDITAGAAELTEIATINKWLASGILDQYNVSIVDYNTFWNDPAYRTGPTGGDNIHKSTYIVDGIHPSQVGYDSLAALIVRQAKLPVLRKVVFFNELDPGGFTGYSRPANITIDGVAYSIDAAVDTLDVAAFVPDSVWIKVISSTNITGTTYSGFSHIQWFQDNNPDNDTLFTRRTPNSNGSQKTTMDASYLKLVPPSPATGYNLVETMLGDGTNYGLQIRTSGAGTNFILNGLTNTAVLGSAVLSIYGANAINTAGTIEGTNASNRFGLLQIQTNGTPTTTGWGISTNNTTTNFDLNTTPATGKHGFRFRAYNGGTQTFNATPAALWAFTEYGFGDATGINQRGYGMYVRPIINQSLSVHTGNQFKGVYYDPIRTNLTNVKHFGFYNTYGHNFLNTSGDSTLIGYDSSYVPLAKLSVNGNVIVDGTATSITSSTALGSTSGGDIRLFAKATPTAADQRLGGVMFGTLDGGSTENLTAGMQAFSTAAHTPGSSEQTHLRFYTSATSSQSEVMRLTANLRVGILSTSPGSLLTIGAGNSSANPFGLTSGTVQTTPTNGSFAYDGTNLLFTPTSNTYKRFALTNNATPSNGQIPIGNGTDYTAAAITAGTGVSVTNGAGTITVGLNSSYITSGTYTPTITNGTNVAGSTAYTCQYMRVGNVVTVSGRIDIDPTAAAVSTQLTITLPVSSSFSGSNQCGGTSFCPNIAGLGAAILSDGVNQAMFQFVPSDINNNPHLFSFTYLIN